MTDTNTGTLEFVPNQPTLFDLIHLTDNLVEIKNEFLTVEIAMALRKVNHPPMIFKGEQP